MAIENSTGNLVLSCMIPSYLYFMLTWVIITQSLQLQENNNENASHAMCYVISMFRMWFATSVNAIKLDIHVGFHN
jgi:hypothetical protein